MYNNAKAENFYSLVSIAYIKSECMLRNATYQDARIRECIKKAPGASGRGSAGRGTKGSEKRMLFESTHYQPCLLTNVLEQSIHCSYLICPTRLERLYTDKRMTLLKKKKKRMTLLIMPNYLTWVFWSLLRGVKKSLTGQEEQQERPQTPLVFNL